MKLVVPAPRHSRTPAWMRDCVAPVSAEAASASAASAQSVVKRIMAFPYDSRPEGTLPDV